MSGKLKEVRLRIGSVNSTKQITLAMKLVSASKLRKAQEAITNMRPYSERLSNMLKNLAVATEGEVEIAEAAQRDVRNALVVLITSDRGLCGGFNANLIKKSKAALEDLEGAKTSLMIIGKKGFDAYKRSEVELNTDFQNLFEDVSFENTSKVSELLLSDFASGKYDKVIVIYSEFKNAVSQEYKADQFLPIAKIETGGDEEKAKEMNSDYIFEPNKVELIQQLVPKILKTQFHKYILDNNASEHGARMTSMDNATENANDLLKELKISYNRARQAAITTELTEIVSGAAALKAG